MQGGLEIPCLLKLETTDSALMTKASKLLDCCQEKDEESESQGQPPKKIKLEDKENLMEILSPCQKKTRIQKYG